MYSHSGCLLCAV
uniref:Uncharacterized protein n=1 Tax=Anguilla anguilla TaxID=7936 RepID=A0A0E9RCZ3_ANGAN